MSVHMHPYANHICDRGPQKSPLSPPKPRQFVSLAKCDKSSRMWYIKTKQNKKMSMCVYGK